MGSEAVRSSLYNVASTRLRCGPAAARMEQATDAVNDCVRSCSSTCLPGIATVPTCAQPASYVSFNNGRSAERALSMATCQGHLSSRCSQKKQGAIVAE